MQSYSSELARSPSQFGLVMSGAGAAVVHEKPVILLGDSRHYIDSLALRMGFVRQPHFPHFWGSLKTSLKQFFILSRSNDVIFIKVNVDIRSCRYGSLYSYTIITTTYSKKKMYVALLSLETKFEAAFLNSGPPGYSTRATDKNYRTSRGTAQD